MLLHHEPHIIALADYCEELVKSFRKYCIHITNLCIPVISQTGLSFHKCCYQTKVAASDPEQAFEKLSANRV